MGRGAKWWLNALCLLVLSIAFSIFYNKWRSLKRLEANQCSMTYMWRRIYYLDTGLKHKVYSLLLYAEGSRRAQRYGESGTLNGLPIIFVPGNAGSGGQVRSLGSLLQNKTERLGTHFHFDTFALDFNGEMTALNFDYVESQAQFLATAIDHILTLYSAHNSPKIVLIGHSMGGIVIQKMLEDRANANDRRRRGRHIAFIMTFATPFSQPPVLLEKRFLRFWDSMNAVRLEKQEADGSAERVPKTVSVSGGLLDEFIDEGWTQSPAVSVHAHTASIDRIWAETDHLCIVWCNEIVRQTSRFLFDYAAFPSEFLENFHNFARLHYHSLGLRLSPIISESTPLVDLNASLCVPKCPFNSMHQQIDLLANPIERRRLLLAIAKFNNHLVVPNFNLLTVPNCGQNTKTLAGTRFLDAAHLFAVANLSNCDGQGRVLIAKNTNLWLLDEDSVFLPAIHLCFFDFFWRSKEFPIKKTNFTMEMRPLVIIPIHFLRNGNEFGIFRVEFRRKKCHEKINAHRRIVFFADGIPRRFDKVGTDSNLTSSLLIYPTTKRQNPNKSGSTHYQLMIIDTAQCAECSVHFSIDLRFSLIGLFRQIQPILPASLVFVSLFVHLYASISAASGRYFLVVFVLPILLLTVVTFCGTDGLLLLFLLNAAALLFFHLLLFTLCPFVLAFHRHFAPPLLPLRALFFLCVLSTTFTNNSSPLALFCLGLNIAALHRRFVSTSSAIAFSSASLLLVLAVIIFQLPHTFTLVWNLAKYGQLWSLSDPFLAPNLALSLFSFFAFFRIPFFKLSDAFLYPFLKLFALSLFPFSLVAFFTFAAFVSPKCFLLLDDLSFLAVLAFANTFLFLNKK